MELLLLKHLRGVFIPVGLCTVMMDGILPFPCGATSAKDDRGRVEGIGSMSLVGRVSL